LNKNREALVGSLLGVVTLLVVMALLHVANVFLRQEAPPVPARRLLQPLPREVFKELVLSAKNQQEVLEILGTPDRNDEHSFPLLGEWSTWTYRNPKVYDPITTRRDSAVEIRFPKDRNLPPERVTFTP
jgi:hypothetical protein